MHQYRIFVDGFRIGHISYKSKPSDIELRALKQSIAKEHKISKAGISIMYLGETKNAEKAALAKAE